MGYVRLLRGDHEGAIRNYNEALRQDPFDAEALLNRALELDNLGRHEEALADYKRILASTGKQLPGARPHAEVRVRELSP
jgi:tetratricopeptide (TPR) repeat protein